MNQFATLISQFNTHANNNTLDTKAGTKALTDLATAIVYSVLNKCLDPQRKKALESGTASNSGQSPLLRKLKAEIYAEQNRRERMDYCLENFQKEIYNANGDVEVITDRELNKAIDELIKNPVADSADLIQECILALMEECNRMKQSGEPVDLERPYIRRALSKRVVIKTEDTNAWTDVETTPIQEVYRAVRRYIMDNRAFLADARCKYSYIAELSADSESDTVDTIYRRLGKYADLGGYAKDFNGAATLYSVEEETVHKLDELVEKLNLTKRQAEILDLRFKGYGKKAIATYLKVDTKTIYIHLQRMQEDMKKLGLIPPTIK